MMTTVIVVGYIIVSFIVFNLLRHIVQAEDDRFDSYDALVCVIFAFGWPFTMPAIALGRYMRGRNEL